MPPGVVSDFDVMLNFAGTPTVMALMLVDPAFRLPEVALTPIVPVPFCVPYTLTLPVPST